MKMQLKNLESLQLNITISNKTEFQTIYFLLKKCSIQKVTLLFIWFMLMSECAQSLENQV